MFRVHHETCEIKRKWNNVKVCVINPTAERGQRLVRAVLEKRYRAELLAKAAVCERD
jgi:hypothetical protein